MKTRRPSLSDVSAHLPADEGSDAMSRAPVHLYVNESPRYYLAGLSRPERDALSCLLRHVFTADQAGQLVANAQVNKSPAIIAPISDDKAILIARVDGKLFSWKALTAELFDSEKEALEVAAALSEQLGTNVGMFVWIQPSRDPTSHEHGRR
jgi:hypothetical protein